MALDKEKVKRYNELDKELCDLNNILTSKCYTEFAARGWCNILNEFDYYTLPSILTEPIRELIKNRIKEIEEEMEAL